MALRLLVSIQSMPSDVEEGKLRRGSEVLARYQEQQGLERLQVHGHGLEGNRQGVSCSSLS